MAYTSLGKKLFFATILILVVLGVVDSQAWVSLFAGSFGFGGALVLWIIEKSSPH